MNANAVRLGEAVAARMDKVNGELFTLTYGALVTQPVPIIFLSSRNHHRWIAHCSCHDTHDRLIKDYEDVEQVNAQLEKMGYNIGVRLIDEFLAKSNVSRCRDFRETADVVAKVAFKMFLGITADVTGWNQEGTACSLLVPAENPITDFVELPASMAKLHYCNLLCGVLRGALEMVQMRVSVRVGKDALKGDDATELRVELLEVLEDQAGEEYDDG